LNTQTSKEEKNCPSCFSNNSKNFSFFKPKEDLNLRVCLNCQFIFKGTSSSIGLLKVQEGEYYSSKKIGSLVDNRFLKHHKRRARNHYSYISKYFDENLERKALDIGSGAGIFLDYLKQKGWEVEGIEPDPLMHSYATRELGLNIKRTLFSDWIPEERYSLIYLSHVLDDLPGLNQNLEKIFKALKRGGYLFIEVPNHSWPFRLNFEKNEDLEIGQYFFSINSLTAIIEKNNFRVLNSTTFHLVHLNTIFQKIVSPIMLLQKLRPKKYRPYLRLIAKKEC
tara:strand:+ start:20350 stop:21189 length:840 start_codon:yes stop_codon:yes gene_type:complete